MNFGLVVAIVAGGLAILVAVINKMTGSKKEENQASPDASVGFSPQAAVPPDKIRKRTNKRGWKAPSGHYFNEADELMTDAGDLIIDLLIISQLCGAEYTEPAPIEEPVGTETIASHLEPEITLKPAEATIQTASDTSSYDSGGDCGGDSGGYDDSSGL